MAMDDDDEFLYGDEPVPKKQKIESPLESSNGKFQIHNS